MNTEICISCEGVIITLSNTEHMIKDRSHLIIGTNFVLNAITVPISLLRNPVIIHPPMLKHNVVVIGADIPKLIAVIECLCSGGNHDKDQRLG